MMKTIAYAAPTSYVTEISKVLKKGGYIVDRDNQAGTCVGKTPEGEVIFRALKMGKAWSVRGDTRVFTPDDSMADGGVKLDD